MGKKRIVKVKGKPDEGSAKILATHRAIGEHFGVKLSTVRKWASDGMPGSVGNYNLNEISVWVAINRKSKKPHREKKDSELNDEAVRATAIQEIEKAAKLGLERKRLERIDRIEEGGLCRLDDVNRFLTEFLTEYRQIQNRMVVDFAAGYGQKLQSSLREDLGARIELMQNQMADWCERLEEVEIVN